jgi:hypothetical protein
VRSEPRSSAAIACAEVRAKVAARPPGESARGGLRLAHLQRPAGVALVGCLQRKGSRGQRSAVAEQSRAAHQSLKGGVVCKELRWQSVVLNREG